MLVCPLNRTVRLFLASNHETNAALTLPDFRFSQILIILGQLLFCTLNGNYQYNQPHFCIPKLAIKWVCFFCQYILFLLEIRDANLSFRRVNKSSQPKVDPRSARDSFFLDGLLTPTGIPRHLSRHQRANWDLIG